MAKKKIKIAIKEKLHYKKPLKDCSKAIDDIVRIRNNEQSKLRRLTAKFKAIPKGKQKKQADILRRDIKAFEKGISELKTTVTDIRVACNYLDKNKSKIKSLKLKAANINNKLKKTPKKDVGGPAYKKLQAEYLKQQNLIKELQTSNTDVLYRVNKGLGFDPEIIAERFDISKKYLEKHHSEDFDEEYFEELTEFQEISEGGGGGVAGGGFVPEEIEEEEEIAKSGYIELSDDIFWQASQDFNKNVSFSLNQYDKITIEYGSSMSNGDSGQFKGTSLSLVTMKFDAMIRWASTHEPYIRIAKLISTDQKKLKYIGYYDKDGRNF